MIKKTILIPVFVILCSINCHAEGQDGISEIFNIGYTILYWACIFTYTLIGGVIIKLILKNLDLLPNGQMLKAFLISFVMTILFVAIFGKDFTFFIWNHL
ncbi:hypothetical protein ACFSJW_22750 [Flavobacterium artemisiae]|uniref:Uncharacterized protein n=1 Tax=Flavobacterium artemisiae TaxID=2126556 RepID=A0ABW4H7M5_9FLAO